jgi:hypothetical protein
MCYPCYRASIIQSHLHIVTCFGYMIGSIGNKLIQYFTHVFKYNVHTGKRPTLTIAGVVALEFNLRMFYIL